MAQGARQAGCVVATPLRSDPLLGKPRAPSQSGHSRRLSPSHSPRRPGPFALAACYHRDHRYYAPMRQFSNQAISSVSARRIIGVKDHTTAVALGEAMGTQRLPPRWQKIGLGPILKQNCDRSLMVNEEIVGLGHW